MRKQREPRDWNGLITGSISAGMAVVAAAAVIALTSCQPGPSWQLGHDVEEKMELFPWATRECVIREIGNPDYRNNDEKLRLCMLEDRMDGLDGQGSPDPYDRPGR